MTAWIAGLLPDPAGATVAAAFVLALLLGLRHATDPDHLTAVATLVLSDAREGVARAGRLGLAWGIGHATTLFLFGLPVVLVGRALPARAHQAAELAVGVVIVLLALRLLVRWKRGYFHVHAHEHGGVLHAHPHFHEPAHGEEHPADDHAHSHAVAGRTPAAAFGVGLLHGVGGSAGAGVLLIAAIPRGGEATAALLVFAGATALSMAGVSAAVGRLLVTGRSLSAYVERTVPYFGAVSLGVGVLYALAALDLVPFFR